MPNHSKSVNILNQMVIQVAKELKEKTNFLQIKQPIKVHKYKTRKLIIPINCNTAENNDSNPQVQKKKYI